MSPFAIAYRRVPPPGRFYWICQTLGWGFFLTYVLGGYYIFGDRQTTDVINIVFFICVVCPLASHGLRHWMWRRGWVELPGPALAARLVVVVAAMAGSLTLLTNAGLLLMQGTSSMPWQAQTSIFAGFAGAFTGWLLIYFAVRARRGRHSLELLARDAQLRALHAQLNPHFLFNCLNSVRGLIVEDPDKAAGMVTGLADLLRYSLTSDKKETVTLADELAIIEEYLNLERVRFEERLQVELMIDSLALTARVPPMLVLALVENAVKHGIAGQESGGMLRLEARAPNKTLAVRVTSTGVFKPASGDGGYGLRNAVERLSLLYGSSASLTVTGDDKGHTVASLSVPIQIRDERAAG